jgi:hypothetical protein
VAIAGEPTWRDDELVSALPVGAEATGNLAYFSVAHGLVPWWAVDYGRVKAVTLRIGGSVPGSFVQLSPRSALA